MATMVPSRPQLMPSFQLAELQPDQEGTLELQFRRNKNPHPTDLMILAAETGLEEQQVKLWFARRIAVWRKEQGLSPLGGRVCD